MRFPNYRIIMQVDPVVTKPFGVVETYMSLDGPRSRISRMGFETESAARAFIQQTPREPSRPQVNETGC